MWVIQDQQCTLTMYIGKGAFQRRNNLLNALLYAEIKKDVYILWTMDFTRGSEQTDLYI